MRYERTPKGDTPIPENASERAEVQLRCMGCGRFAKLEDMTVENEYAELGGGILSSEVFHERCNKIRDGAHAGGASHGEEST